MICCLISLSSVCCILISIIFSGLPGLKLPPYDTFVLQMFAINPSQDEQTGWFLCQCVLHPAGWMVRAQLCSTLAVWTCTFNPQKLGVSVFGNGDVSQNVATLLKTYLLPTLELCHYILCYNREWSSFTGWVVAVVVAV